MVRAAQASPTTVPVVEGAMGKIAISGAQPQTCMSVDSDGSHFDRTHSTLNHMKKRQRAGDMTVANTHYHSPPASRSKRSRRAIFAQRAFSLASARRCIIALHS